MKVPCIYHMLPAEAQIRECKAEEEEEEEEEFACKQYHRADLLLQGHQWGSECQLLYSMPDHARDILFGQS